MDRQSGFSTSALLTFQVREFCWGWGQGVVPYNAGCSSISGLCHQMSVLLLLHCENEKFPDKAKVPWEAIPHPHPKLERAAPLYISSWYTFLPIRCALLREQQSHGVYQSSLKTPSIGEHIRQQSSLYRVRPSLCQSSSRSPGLKIVIGQNPIRRMSN